MFRFLSSQSRRILEQTVPRTEGERKSLSVNGTSEEITPTERTLRPAGPRRQINIAHKNKVAVEVVSDTFKIVHIVNLIRIFRCAFAVVICVGEVRHQIKNPASMRDFPPARKLEMYPRERPHIARDPHTIIEDVEDGRFFVIFVVKQDKHPVRRRRGSAVGTSSHVSIGVLCISSPSYVSV